LEAAIDTRQDDASRTSDTRREERRRSILDAAEGLFLEQGYDRVTLGAIVRRSGGSLATVYELFGNKQGLLRAVVGRRKDEGMGGLLDIPESLTPAETLLRYAHQCYAFVTAPRSVALMRIVIGETLAHPEFGREFHQDMNSGPASLLAARFREWTAQGRAAIDDPEAAVELFFAMVMCDAPLKAMLGAVPNHTRCGDIEWRLRPFLERFAIQ
jgi:TetR/AcrR family transcriptional regulator, mexJK operon transcriptional repressor